MDSVLNQVSWKLCVHQRILYTVAQSTQVYNKANVLGYTFSVFFLLSFIHFCPSYSFPALPADLLLIPLQVWANTDWGCPQVHESMLYGLAPGRPLSSGATTTLCTGMWPGVWWSTPLAGAVWPCSEHWTASIKTWMGCCFKYLVKSLGNHNQFLRVLARPRTTGSAWRGHCSAVKRGRPGPVSMLITFVGPTSLCINDLCDFLSIVVSILIKKK